MHCSVHSVRSLLK